VVFKKNYKLSQEFINKLVDQTAGFLSPGLLEEIIRSFNSELSSHFFTYSSESNLLRIILSMYDKNSLLTECLKYPIYIEILVSVAANSNYLTDILVRNPEYFYLIANPSNLEYCLDINNSSFLVKSTIAAFKTFKAKVNSLRGLKRKETLRIGVKDILHKADLVEVTGELSILAKTIAAELFELCYSEVLNKYSLKNPYKKYCLIALGKLGGHELNYSSDIDLIVFYDKNTLLSNKKTFNEILTEAVYLFIESASSISSSGYIYRIDFRLRPDGKTSPLCRELCEYLDYYESRGEDWERQMLIKMDFIVGSKSLYNSFSSYIQHFIYPLSFSNSPVNQIKKIKEKIENKLGDEENIKLIPGGIRDIEFSTQVLQLLNGGRERKLRTPNTIEAIKNLYSLNLLSESEYKNLLNSYILYRRIEHYLQLMNDSQTHTIPREGELLQKLSSFFNFKSQSEFKHAVTINRKSVLKIYRSIMGINSSSNQIFDKYHGIKFINQTKAFSNLQFLREGTSPWGQKQFDKNSMDNFQNIEPQLLNYLELSYNPDKVLQNFTRVIRGISFPSIWYKEFENRKFFNSFLTLCEYSQLSIDLFAENDDLRECVLSKKVFEKISHINFTGSGSLVQDLPANKILFILCVQFSLKLITSTMVRKMFKKYFTQAIIFTAREILTPVIDEREYAIAALGSFGAGEMTFSSDVDLIFIVDGLNLYPDIHKYFQSLFLKLKEILKPFDVDCRLRPEGKSSLLVWDLQSYKNYIFARARTWELQTFCKLNFIAGNKKIICKLIKTLEKKVGGIEKQKLKLDISDMRKKLIPQYNNSMVNSFNLRKGYGGITEIEFLIQYFLLLDKNYFSKCMGKRVDQIIPLMIKADKKYHDLDNLKNNFIFLKEVELANQVIFNSTTSILILNKENTSLLAGILNFNMPDEFIKFFNNIVNLDHSIFGKYLD
jgi:glutamate-ammonia-ligase adenylyltransferase